MGVEFRMFLIPRDNTWRPDTAACRRLLSALREGRFLPRTKGSIRIPGRDEDRLFDEAGAMDRPEFIVKWAIEDRRESGLRHPLMEMTEDDEQGAYFDVSLHFADDFIETASEIIDPPPAECACGEDLIYEAEEDIFYAARIRRVCPSCGEPFRPQDSIAIYTDGVTGEQRELPGGATYRFAIVIDCGKHLQTTDGSVPEATSTFLRVASQALGVELYEVGDFS